MPLFSRVTIYKDDDITPMVAVSTNPADDGSVDTNLLLKTDAIDDPYWGKIQAVTGSLPVVTANADPGPDQRFKAEKVVFAAPTAGDISFIARDGGAITAGNTYTGQFWVKAFAAGDVGKTIVFRNVGRAAYLIITLTADWQKVTRTEVAFNANLYFGFGLTAGANGSSSGTVSVLVARFQLEPGAVAGDYLPNDGVINTLQTYPYLQDESIVYGESKIDFPNGSAGIGQFGFKLLDKRTVATDQTTGFFTALLADINGRGNLLGHRCVWERQQLGGYGIYVTQFDGIVDDCQLDPNLVEYHIPCRDVRERERTNRIFTKHNGTTSLVPNGPVNGWGTVFGVFGHGGMPIQLLPPVAPLIGTFWRDPNGGLAGRVKCQKTQFDLIITGGRYQVLQQYGALTQGSGITGGDTSLAFRNVVIKWRVYPGGGAWNTLQNMPAILGTEYPMNNVFPLQQSTFDGAESRGFIPDGVLASKGKVNFLVNMTGAGIPTHLQQIEFMVLANGQPTAEAPIYWEGNLGQLTKDIYDGLWSNYSPGIRYDQAAMANFIAKAVNGAALIKAPVENGLQWVQENTYKPQGWAPSVPPETGLVTPIQYNLPTVTEPLINITDSIVKEDAKWELAKDELINDVVFQYEAMFVADSKYLNSFADKLGINANNVEPPAQRLGTIPIYYPELNVASQALSGAKTLSYTPETVKLFGILTPNGLDTRLWPDIGAKLAKDRTKEVLDRYAFAGQRLTVNARRSDSGIAGAKMGNWALCGISWLPDYVSKKRGLNRIMQVISVNDDDKVFRKLVLSDAGPNVTPSGQPVLGAITQANGVIDIPFTSIPAGVFANVDFAASVLEPAADSGLWLSAGRTSVATDHITVGPFPPGSSIWIRAVGQEPGKRRSAYTASQHVTITNVPFLYSVQLTFDTDGHARVNWVESSTTLGVRIQYVVYSADLDIPAFTNTVDADATLEQLQLPVIPLYGQAVAVKITPYPGFAAGAVTGVAGTASDTQSNRNPALDPVQLTVEPLTSETATTATLTLTITDPHERLTLVEFKTQAGNAADSGWITDAIGPYATSVALVEKQVSRIWYRVTGRDDNGIVRVLAEDVVTYISGDIPLPPVIQSITFDDSGNLTVSVTGDSDTASFAAAAAIGSDPSLATIRAGTGINGRTATYTFGPYSAGAIVRVGVLAYSGAGKTGQESPQAAYGRLVRPNIPGSQPLPAIIQVTQSTITPPTISAETVTLSGGLASGGVGPYQWRARAYASVGTPPAWGAFSSTALPQDFTVTRALKWAKIIEAQATDASGVITQINYTVISRMDAIDAGTGLLDDSQNTSPSAVRIFRRTVDDASQVVITTSRTFVDPSTSSQVDGSGRIVGVYRLGVIEPVNNLVKFGDALGATTMSSLALNGSVVAQLTLAGSPTNNVQIAIGNSSVWGVHGAMNSSGYQFISYNAYQNTLGADSWTQNLASNPSGLFEVRPDGVVCYSAVAGKAVGNKATFWTTDWFILGGIATLKGLNVTGNNLPAATGSTLYVASGYASPVVGRIFVGDGTGWSLKFSKRVGSVTTDLFSFGDDGSMTVTSTVFAEPFYGVTRGGVAKGYFAVATSANAIITGSVTDDLCVRSVVGASRILFSVDNGASIAASIGSAHLFNGNVTFTNNISVGGTLTVTGVMTITDLHTSGAVQQKKGTATLYDTPTCTVSSSAPPGSSSGYPTGHEWIQVTAPI